MKALTRSLSCALILILMTSPCASAARAADPPKEPLPVTVFQNLKAGKKQTVIACGTGLTIKRAWTQAVGGYFEEQDPGQVTFIDSAKAGMHSDRGAAHFQERILSKRSALVLIGFSSARRHSSQQHLQQEGDLAGG